MPKSGIGICSGILEFKLKDLKHVFYYCLLFMFAAEIEFHPLHDGSLVPIFKRASTGLF